jgi:hypothetical protein
MEFCVELFAELLEKTGVVLADRCMPMIEPIDGYLILECYPTSAWRSSGLTPLPGKARKPALDGYLGNLSRTYGLPAALSGINSHDDVQAIVAAVVALAAIGGPARAIPKGVASGTCVDDLGKQRRLEGIIWNVEPLTVSQPVDVTRR